MDSIEERMQNGDSESTNQVEEESSGDRTISDELYADEADTQQSTTTSSSSQKTSLQRHRPRPKMRRSKTPTGANTNTWRQFYNLRRTRSKDDSSSSQVLNEVAADPNYVARLNGWKLRRVSDVMDDISDLETRNLEVLGELVRRSHCDAFYDDFDNDEEDMAEESRERLHQLIVKCKEARDRIQWLRLQMMRIVDHNPHVMSIVKTTAEKLKRTRQENN